MMSALRFHRGFYYTCGRPLGLPRVSYPVAGRSFTLLGRLLVPFSSFTSRSEAKEVRANRVREIRNRRDATVFLLWIFDVASLSPETETTYMIPVKPRQLWPL